MNTDDTITITKWSQAKAQGLATYFNGIPCKHGHIAERRTNSGGCLICNKTYIRKYKPAKNAEHAAKRASYVRKYQKANKDKIKAYLKISGKKINKNKRDKYHTNIHYRIKSLSASRIRTALKGITKTDNTIKLLGCHIDQFKNHLERQFTKKMSWDNYGSYWHIDHIRPCASYDLTKDSEQKSCFNYINLRPLEAKENIIKKDKVILLC